jgi:transposase
VIDLTSELDFLTPQLSKLCDHRISRAVGAVHRSRAPMSSVLLAANHRLNTAYMLKESFSQLWDYNSEAWARKLFDNWRESLKWQRLKPYEKFADMIERHWDGIAAYCKPSTKSRWAL